MTLPGSNCTKEKPAGMTVAAVCFATRLVEDAVKCSSESMGATCIFRAPGGKGEDERSGTFSNPCFSSSTSEAVLKANG